MAKPVLFLLKPGFHHEAGGPFFCPGCAAVEGYLKYAPQVEGLIEVRRIDFPRPRTEIVALIGEENQSCPVLVLDAEAGLPPAAKRSQETGRAFIAGAVPVCDYLGRTYGTVRPSP
jgi:hypothetical protein